MNTPNENKSTEPTPDQLMMMLELQLEQSRHRARQNSKKRTLVLVGGILLILGGCCLAFLFLQEWLNDHADELELLHQKRQVEASKAPK